MLCRRPPPSVCLARPRPRAIRSWRGEPSCTRHFLESLSPSLPSLHPNLASHTPLLPGSMLGPYTLLLLVVVSAPVDMQQRSLHTFERRSSERQLEGATDDETANVVSRQMNTVTCWRALPLSMQVITADPQLQQTRSAELGHCLQRQQRASGRTRRCATRGLCDTRIRQLMLACSVTCS